MSSSILFILTSADKALDGKPIGYYLPEIAHPFAALKDHFKIVAASPKGGKAPVDQSSVENFKDDESVHFHNSPETQKLVTETLKISEVKASDYAAVFVVGGLVAREIPGVNDYIRQVLEYSKSGPLYLIVFITVINGLAEEMFFRGSLYTALLRHRPVLTSTVLYVIATAATTGNPMLGVAAIILGTVCAFLRRATGGVLAPMLVHFFWGLVMVLALPPMFGV